jgi:hypothetical protein
LQKIGEHLVSTRFLESKIIDFQRYKGMVRVPSIPLKVLLKSKAFLLLKDFWKGAADPQKWVDYIPLSTSG